MISNPQLGTLFTALGYASGAAMFYWALRYPPKGVADPVTLTSNQRTVILITGLLGGVLGAKLTQWLALGWPIAIPAETILSPSGGRTLLGGVIVGWICVELAKWILGVKRSLGAPFAIGLTGGEILGRIGCLFNACCFGRPCASATHDSAHPWWSVFQHGDWRYPVQLYSAAVALLLLLFLLRLRPRLKRDGDLFYVYLAAYGATRFGLEFLRASEHIYYGLSLAQLVCLELFAAGGIALCLGWLRRNKSAGATSGSGEGTANPAEAAQHQS